MASESPKVDGSRLRFLMKTNNVPTDLERLYVGQQIAECNAEIENVSKEIAKEVEGANDELVSQHKKLRQDRLSLKRILSPVRCIPPEILSQIFLLGLNRPHRTEPHPRRPPLVYGRICSFWRMVSYSTPVLWTTLPLSIEYPKLPKLLVDLVKEWLHRAHPYPLDVTVLCAQRTPGNYVLNHAILPFSAHLQKLSLWLPSHQVQPLIDPPYGFPLLEVVDLGDSSNNWEGLPLISFLASPRLHTITFRSTKFLPSNIADFGSLKQLTELSLEREIPASLFITILSLTPSLRTLSAHIRYDRDHMNTHCTHTGLTSLCIRNSDNNILSVSALTLPALQHFSASGPMELISLINLQYRSMFPLKTLNLGGFLISTSSDLLVSSLRRIPTLTDICFGYISADSILLDAFCYHHLDNDVLPCLETLKIYDTSALLKCQDYMDMIRTRWWPEQNLEAGIMHAGVTRLKSLSMKLSTHPRPEEMQQIKEFREQGLVVQLL